MPARILVVEDDPVSRDLLASLLGARGYHVETADDSFGALRLIQDYGYDLVFIDYHLPEMDGYALARMMRTLGEKSGANLNMVAITADKFGLAARRGADAVFDRILAKPIEPEALFAFTDGFFDATDDRFAPAVPEPSVFDEFLEETPRQETPSAAQLIWRMRGLSDCPTAAAFPAPSPSERAALEHCFHLVDPEAAECWLLLNPNGLPDIEALRETAAGYLKPLFCLDEASRSIADLLFTVGDADSWTAAATVLAAFADQSRDLSADALESRDFDRRLLAYLRVCGHPVVIRRDTEGRIALSGTGGFRPVMIVPAMKRLGALGFVSAKTAPGRPDELVVTITAAGMASVGRPIVAVAPAC